MDIVVCGLPATDDASNELTIDDRVDDLTFCIDEPLTLSCHTGQKGSYLQRGAP
jgi:hypothetical protein